MNLRPYDTIVLSLSGGKDSQAMLAIIAALAIVQGVHSKLKPIHIDTGNEWPESQPHCEMMVAAAGLSLTTIKPLRPMLDEIKRRARWPCASIRYCTSSCKRDPYDKFIRTLNPGRILHVTGERAEESSNRAELPQREIETRLTTQKRTVTRWRPLFEFSEDDVFEIIRHSGLPPHPVYGYGLPRMSCMFCVLARDKDLRISAERHPAIAQAFVALEKSIGHTFKRKKSLEAILAWGKS